MKLRTIDIEHNNLKSISSNELKNNTKKLYLNGNDLSELGALCGSNFPKLKELRILKNNFNCSYLSNIRKTCGALKLIDENTGKAVKVFGIDCHYQPTVDPVELTTKADKITLKTIEIASSFPCNQNYSKSEISLNCSMPYLGTYFNGSSDLERLDFSFMGLLAKIPSNIFAHNRELLWVSFSYNRISEIDSFAFVDAKKLFSIDISYNLLKIIPSNLFANNGELINADFSYNEINEIDVLAFVGAKKLETILFSNNHLKIIPSSALPNGEKLPLADFSFNEIYGIDPLAFAGAQNLWFFNISHSLLKTIPSNAFANNTELQFADFSHSQICGIGSFAFDGARLLYRIDISYNSLKTIPSNFFANNVESMPISHTMKLVRSVHSLLLVQRN